MYKKSKMSIIGKIYTFLPTDYIIRNRLHMKKAFQYLITEYKQVKWPSLRKTINLAVFVIIVSAIITAVVLGLDAFFFKLRSLFIIK
jgi:preprotein translocase SecE subunit